MQRYDPSAEIWGQMDPYSDGNYVLAEEAQAEIDALHAECDELLHRREEAQKTCKWKLDDDGFWETDCGHGFTLNDGTLGENRMAFCPYCGHRVEEVQS